VCLVILTLELSLVFSSALFTLTIELLVVAVVLLLMLSLVLPLLLSVVDVVLN